MQSDDSWHFKNISNPNDRAITPYVHIEKSGYYYVRYRGIYTNNTSNFSWAKYISDVHKARYLETLAYVTTINSSDGAIIVDGIIYVDEPCDLAIRYNGGAAYTPKSTKSGATVYVLKLKDM